MKQKLLFFILSITISSIAFSQTADSTKSKKDKKLSFEVLLGLGKWNYLNETYTDKRVDRYTNPSGHSISSLDIEDLKQFSPTIKFALVYQTRKYISAIVGIKYFHSEIAIDYEGTFYYDVPQSYYTQTSNGASLSNKTNGIQLNVGPRFNYKNFNMSTTFNINTLAAIQSYSDWHAYGSYGDFDNAYGDKQITEYAFGGGVNIGYQIPMEKHFFLIEFQCDYMSHKLDFYYLKDGFLNSINNSLAIGIKF